MNRATLAAALSLVLTAALPAGETLQERLRQRMNARPTPEGEAYEAAAPAAPASPEDLAKAGRQQDCQARVDKRRFRTPRDTRTTLNPYGLNPEGRTVDCEGAEDVDRVLTRKPPARFDGLEGPHFFEDTGTKPDSRSLKLRLGARLAGEGSVRSPVDVGFTIYKKRGSVECIGVFDQNHDSWSGLPQIAIKVDIGFFAEKTWVSRTSAPWVKLRLDHGALYYGQLAGGVPEGLGFLFTDDLRAGRFGFFHEGKRHGGGIEWETRVERLRLPDEPDAKALRASVDWIHRVRHKLDEEKANEVFQTVPKGFVRVGGDESYQEWNRWVKDRKSTAEAIAEGKKKKAEYRAEFAAAERGSVLEGGFVVVGAYKVAHPRYLVLHDGSKVNEGDPLDVAVPGRPIEVPGFGTYGWGAAEKEDLRKWAEAHYLAVMKKAAAEAAAKDAAMQARFQKDMETKYLGWRAARAQQLGVSRPSSGGGGGGSSYRPSRPVIESGPRIGTAQWHQNRALTTHPMTYYQNKYKY